MNSMNAYGKGLASTKYIQISVEIRSSSNRHRDIQFYLPRPYLSLESQLRKKVETLVQRGKLEIHVRRISTGGDLTISPNIQIAREYQNGAIIIAQSLGHISSEELTMSDIEKICPISLVIQQPGVFQQVERKPNALEELPLLITSLEAAMTDLNRTRQTEGKEIYEKMNHHLRDLQQFRLELETEQSGFIMHLQERFAKRLSRILGERIDEQTLAKEVALIVEKSDVEEELLQLQTLTDQFFQVMKQHIPVQELSLDDIFASDINTSPQNVACGRKLEFIAQDLSKKINILSSKINNHKSISAVISFKESLEKVRELISVIE